MAGWGEDTTEIKNRNACQLDANEAGKGRPDQSFWKESGSDSPSYERHPV